MLPPGCVSPAPPHIFNVVTVEYGVMSKQNMGISCHEMMYKQNMGV